jgi:hypothetical protein
MYKKVPKPNVWSLINVTLCILLFLTLTIAALFQRKYIIGIIALSFNIFSIRGFIRIYKVYNSNKHVSSNK